MVFAFGKRHKGCVWGNQLMAYRLEDQQLFAVDNPLAEW